MYIKQEPYHINNPRGQYLVEILVALGVFVIFAGALATLVLDANVLLGATSKQYQKEWYLREGREAIRSIKLQGWNTLELGTYGLTNENGKWELTNQSDTRKDMTRTASIEWIERDATTQNIVDAGIPDAYGKKITLRITDTSSGSILTEETIYHTIPLANTWIETTEADFLDGTFSSTQTTNISGGEITLTETGQSASGFSYAAISTTNALQLSRQSRKVSFQFSAPDFSSTTSVYIYVSSIRGTSPTYRVGLQASDPQGNPDGTWLGSNNLGFGTFAPQTVGWHQIKLQEPVSVTAGGQTSLLVEWDSGRINNQNNIQLLVANPASGINPTTGESDTHRNVSYSLNGNRWITSLYEPLFVITDSTNNTFGNAYATGAATQIFNTQHAGQRLVVGGTDIELSQARFLVAYESRRPAGDLVVTIRDVTDNTILASGTLATPQSASRTLQWIETQFTSGVILPAGHQIRFELSSPQSIQSRPYITRTHSTEFLDPFMSVSFQGKESYQEIYSTSPGVWIGSPAQDMPFQIISPGGPSEQGEYISSVFDTQNAFTKPVALLWNGDMPKGSSLGVQIRTDQNPLSILSQTWIGPDGTDKTFFGSIDEIHLPETANSRYLQYRCVLTSNGIVVPSLYDLSFIYE